jgi:hypothetical protein
MMIIISIVAFLSILVIITRVYLLRQFNAEVNALFNHSKNGTHKEFTYSQLDGLPLPVQQYFKHDLKEGQRYINYVRLTHDGQFKSGLNKKWAAIKGVQYFTTQNPGFIWKGITSMFTARDMYIASNGRLVVTLFGLIKVVDAQGETFSEAELQRWVAESVWFPTNLLPSERIHWSGIDSTKATLNFRYGQFSISFIVAFNAAFEITTMETMRFMDKEKKERWCCTMLDYRETDAIVVPFKAEASWKLATGEYSYARFSLKKIQYNNPISF